MVSVNILLSNIFYNGPLQIFYRNVILHYIFVYKTTIYKLKRVDTLLNYGKLS